MDGFLAQILLFAGNFAPRGWAFCRGQLLPIGQHEALFAIIGNQYGGDGKTTFAVPDLRGRIPIGPTESTPSAAVRLGERLRRRRRPGPATLTVEFVMCIDGSFPQRP